MAAEKRRVITTSAIKDKEREKEHQNGSILRPADFTSYIGQTKVKEQVLLKVKSAVMRNAPADHMLFYGPPGLGKTTLAHIVANAEAVPLKEMSGPSIEKPGDIAAALMVLKSREVLFIDEIHRIPKACEEVLYSAMEDGYLNITVGSGEQQKVVNIKLPPFTLIGATTKAGMISAPLRDRFPLKCRMEYYSDDELAEIVKRSAVKLDIEISDSDAMMIAGAGRGTPRIANMILLNVRDVATVKNKGIVTQNTVREALSLMEIDSNGLTGMDRQILTILSGSGSPTGLQTIADVSGEDAGTIEEVYEPHLIKEGLVVKTPRGRMLSERGKEVCRSF